MKVCIQAQNRRLLPVTYYLIRVENNRIKEIDSASIKPLTLRQPMLVKSFSIPPL